MNVLHQGLPLIQKGKQLLTGFHVNENQSLKKVLCKIFAKACLSAPLCCHDQRDHDGVIMSIYVITAGTNMSGPHLIYALILW